MTPRSWIAAGWALMAPAVLFGLLAYAYTDNNFPAGTVTVEAPGVALGGLPGYLGSQICVLLAGVVFSGALACFFRAAHLRLLASVAEVRTLFPPREP